MEMQYGIGNLRDELGYGKDSSVILIKLVMTGFGLIQGLDWLNNYGVILNGKESIVTFGLESGEPCVN